MRFIAQVMSARYEGFHCLATAQQPPVFPPSSMRLRQRHIACKQKMPHSSGCLLYSAMSTLHKLSMGILCKPPRATTAIANMPKSRRFFLEISADTDTFKNIGRFSMLCLL